MTRLWIGALVAVTLAGAAVADRLHPPRPPVPVADAPAEPGGVWVCPVVKVAGSGGFIHLVNAGDDRSTIRITYVADGRAPVEQALTLAPQVAGTVGPPRSLLGGGAGAIVEYAGGSVSVSRTALVGVPGGFAAGAAPCAKPGGVIQVVPQGSTLRAETQLILLNPGTADAVVDIALMVNGQALRPVSLQGRVVPAHRRLVVREGDFAFDARAVAAVMTAATGRIVADALVVSGSTAEVVPGVNPTRNLLTVASTARGDATFSTLAIGDDDAVIDARVLSSIGQMTYTPLTTGLAPNTPQVAPMPGQDAPPGAVALSAVSKTSAIAIGARWGVASSGRNDVAISSGVQPSRAAVAVVGFPANLGTIRLLVANPDAVEDRLSVTVISESGATQPAALQNVQLPGGHTATLAVPGSTRPGTIGVIVTSVGGRVASALEAIVSNASVYGVYAVTALPVANPLPVAVSADARQGVPAP